MVYLLSALSLAASLIASVAAHGEVTSLDIAGVNYPASEVIRPVGGENPLTDRNSDDVICNDPGNPNTPSFASANPGDSITFNWEWTDDRHPGPMVTALSYCGDADDSCQGLIPQGDAWFKIHQTGLLEPSTDFDGGQWASDKLKADGKQWTITLPQGLKAGAYILRHDITAMHLVGNPEFYPSCTHLVVGGSGTGTPPASSLFAIPGYLSTPQATEALDFNIFAIYSSFDIAGPDVVTDFSGSGSSAPASTPDDGPAAAPAPTSGSSSPSRPKAPAAKPSGKPSPKPTSPGSGSSDPEDDDGFCGGDDDDDSSEDAAPVAKKNRKFKGVAASKPSPATESPAPADDDDEDNNSGDDDAAPESEGPDYSKRFVSGVKVVRNVLKRMNGRHGKRRLSERH